MLDDMKRIGLTVAAAALLLAACAGNSVEATVNGVDIMTSDVEGFVYEPSEFTDTPQQFAAFLGQAIEWEAVEQRVSDELGFEPSDEDIEAEVRQVVISAGFLDIPNFLIQQNVSEETLNRAARHLVIQQHLRDMLEPDIEDPTDEEVQEALDANPENWISEVCASHILTLTSADADAVLERLEAGEEFADLAIELSIDTVSAGQGGSLGCADPAGYPFEFAQATRTAEIGEAVGPVQGQSGFHVIQVQSREPTPFEDVRTALKALEVVAAVSEWLEETVKAATVTVAEERGTWVTDPSPFVQPPAQLG